MNDNDDKIIALIRFSCSKNLKLKLLKCLKSINNNNAIVDLISFHCFQNWKLENKLCSFHKLLKYKKSTRKLIFQLSYLISFPLCFTYT